MAEAKKKVCFGADEIKLITRIEPKELNLVKTTAIKAASAGAPSGAAWLVAQVNRAPPAVDSPRRKLNTVKTTAINAARK